MGPCGEQPLAADYPQALVASSAGVHLRIDPRAAARELLRRAAARRNFVPHTPHPKQRAFLDLTCLEALYGGAAGGGKSDALLMAAAQYVEVPGYAALILRRTYADLALPNAIMDRAKQWWIPQGIKWNDKDKRFTFPSGATITFGYLDTEHDRYRYQGAELQYIAFDELTQFPKEWYVYLLSRLRRLEGSPIPLRVRSASNPGGVGHDWVKRRFMEGGEPSSVFVPAGLADNPSIDAAAYLEPLQRLDPVLRSQLLDGIWVRDGSGLVYAQFDEARNLGAAPKLQYLILGLDFGIVDQNAVSIIGWRDHDPTLYCVASYRKTALVTEMAEHVAELEARWKFARIVGDVGGMGKAFAEEMRIRHRVPIEAADKQNKTGYISLLNGDLEAGRVKLHPTDCGDLAQEWRELPWDEKRVKEAEGFNNHASDSFLYAWRAATAFYERPMVPAKDPKEAWERHWNQRDGADDVEREHLDRLEREEQSQGEWWERE